MLNNKKTHTYSLYFLVSFLFKCELKKKLREQKTRKKRFNSWNVAMWLCGRCICSFRELLPSFSCTGAVPLALWRTHILLSVSPLFKCFFFIPIHTYFFWRLVTFHHVETATRNNKKLCHFFSYISLLLGRCLVERLHRECDTQPKICCLCRKNLVSASV